VARSSRHGEARKHAASVQPARLMSTARWRRVLARATAQRFRIAPSSQEQSAMTERVILVGSVKTKRDRARTGEGSL
jgi:hypothetical protein